MAVLLNDDEQEEFKLAYKAWWFQRGWIYDLLTGLVGLLFLSI